MVFPAVFTSVILFFGSLSIYRIYTTGKKISENTLKRVLFWQAILTALLVISGIGQAFLSVVTLPAEHTNIVKNYFSALNVLFIIYIAFTAEEIGKFGEAFGFNVEEKREKPGASRKIEKKAINRGEPRG